MLVQDHVPFEADLAVPPNPELTRVVTSPEFSTFVERVKSELEVDISAVTYSAPTTNTTASSSTPPDMSVISGEPFFRIRCQRSNSDSVATAREMLESFLTQNNLPIYQSTGGHKRSDSFADAFPHFNSKLLSTSTAAHAPGSLPWFQLVWYD